MLAVIDVCVNTRCGLLNVTEKSVPSIVTIMLVPSTTTWRGSSTMRTDDCRKDASDTDQDQGNYQGVSKEVFY